MSSRLLSMKFMQRAAASAANNPATAQGNARQAQDDTDSSRPSPKRQKVSDRTSSQTGNATFSAASDLEAISAAVKAEDAKRAAAISRQAAEAGETEWVLEFPPGAVAPAPNKSHAVSDGGNNNDDDDDEMGDMIGRKGYGNFKRKKGTTQTPQGDVSGQPSSSADVDNSRRPRDLLRDQASDGEDDEDSELHSMIRDAKSEANRQNKKKRKNAPSTNKRDGSSHRSGNGLSGNQRGSDKVNLNRLTSISSGKASSGISKPGKKSEKSQRSRGGKNRR